MSGVFRHHVSKLVLFSLLSGADLWMTWRLLRQGGGLIYECNPVASAWLTCFGWAGLVAFKLAMVCFIGVLAIFISLYRPRASGGVLMFGCAVTAGVVLYSFYLSHLIANHTAELVAEAAAQQTLADASAQQQRREVYRQFMERLRGDLIAGRSSLRH